jgi:hypothetical protein
VQHVCVPPAGHVTHLRECDLLNFVPDLWSPPASRYRPCGSGVRMPLETVRDGSVR